MVVALLVSALAVVAAPVDFIPQNSLGLVTINANKIIDNPTLNGMLSGIVNKEFQKEKIPLTFNDLRGQVAVGLVSNGKGAFQFCVAGEFSPKVVATFRNAIIKDLRNNKKVRAIRVNGKPGFADDEIRMIFYSPTTVLMQITVEGKMPFVNLKQGRKTNRSFKELFMAGINIPKVLAVVPKEQLAGMPPQIKDVNMVAAKVDVNGDVASAEVILQCKTAEACNFAMVMIDQMKQDPKAAQVFAKIKITRRGNTIQARASMTIAEIIATVNGFVAASPAAGK